ncbi:Glycogen accumulation regulator GarA [compost metagenome]
MSAAPQAKDTVKFDVEVVRGPHAGLKLSFTKPSVTLGRGPENDIVLSSDPRVSRQHAEIKQRGHDFVIVNLSQKNFIMVNGNNVQTEIISNDSVIMVGDCEIRLRADSVAPGMTPAAPSAPAPSLVPSGPKPDFSQAVPRPVTPPPAHQKQGYAPPATSAPPMPPPGTSRQAPPASGGLMANPRARFYGIVVVIGLVLWFLLSPSKKTDVKDPNAFRTSELALADVRESEKNSQELLSIKKEKYDTVQYRRAQENFIKGFRDYQQGQYARARESFQVVLNLDPENELAKRYYHLSKIKFDEMVKFNMIQGNRYREKKNWRMCQSSYSAAMTMLQNRRDDPTFKEAKQYFEQCALNGEGRF